MPETEFGYIPDEPKFPAVEMTEGMIRSLGGEPKVKSTEEEFKKQQELEKKLAEERRQSQLKNRRVN